MFELTSPSGAAWAVLPVTAILLLLALITVPLSRLAGKPWQGRSITALLLGAAGYLAVDGTTRFHKVEASASSLAFTSLASRHAEECTGLEVVSTRVRNSCSLRVYRGQKLLHTSVSATPGICAQAIDWLRTASCIRTEGRSPPEAGTP